METPIHDPEGVSAIDVTILNWIGKFVKPMEARIEELERQVRFLESVVISPVDIRIKEQDEDN